MLLAILVRFEIAADHASVAQGHVFVRNQRMIEGIRLEEFAGVFHGRFLLRHFLVDTRLNRFIFADLLLSLRR